MNRPVQTITFACGHRKFCTARDCDYLYGKFPIVREQGNQHSCEARCPECREAKRDDMPPRIGMMLAAMGLAEVLK